MGTSTDHPDEHPFAWTITADYMPDRFDDDMQPYIVNLAGLVGPEDCDLTSEEIARHPLAMPFRLSDEDGPVREGFLLGDVGDLPPTIPGTEEPWHSICRGSAHTVELYQRGRWQRAEYKGMFFDDWSPFGL